MFLSQRLGRKLWQNCKKKEVPVWAAGIKGAANVEVDRPQLERPILVQGQHLVMNNHNCDIDDDHNGDFDDKIHRRPQLTSVKRFKLRFSLIEEAISKTCLLGSPGNAFAGNHHGLLATPCNGRCRLSIIQILHICVLLICAAVEYVDCWSIHLCFYSYSSSHLAVNMYTFERQFAAAVFVSLWVDGQQLLVDGQCLLILILPACWWTMCSWMLSSTLA